MLRLPSLHNFAQTNFADRCDCLHSAQETARSGRYPLCRSSIASPLARERGRMRVCLEETISKNLHRLPDIRGCALNPGLNSLCSSRAPYSPIAFPTLSKFFLRQPVLPPSHYGYRQCTGPNRLTPGTSHKNDWSRSGQHRKSRLSIVTIPPISYRQTPSVPGLALLAERTDHNNRQLPRVARATSSARNWAIRVRHRHSVCKPHPEPEFLSH